MKKELFAGLTIFLLLLGATYNILHLKKLIHNMDSHIQASENACNSYDYAAAERSLHNALNVWLDSDGYTHVFIRHAEIDAATDALYEALSSVQEQSSSSLSAIEKVQYHIKSIYSMEQMTIKSIF